MKMTNNNMEQFNSSLNIIRTCLFCFMSVLKNVWIDQAFAQDYAWSAFFFVFTFKGFNVVSVNSVFSLTAKKTNWFM